MSEFMLDSLPLSPSAFWSIKAQVDKMLWVDYAISFLVMVSAVFGLMRGFVKEAFALLSWLAAIGIGLYYSRDFAVLFQSSINSPIARISLAFALLFILTLILGGLISFILNHLVEKSGLAIADRLIGMLFGLMRGALLIALLVFSAGVTRLPEHTWWKQALLIPPFQSLAVWLKDHIPPDLAGYIHFR